MPEAIMPVDGTGHAAQAPDLNFGTGQTVAVGASSSQSATIIARAALVSSTTNCWIVAGAAPTVSKGAPAIYLRAGQIGCIALNPGWVIAALQDSAAGTLCIIPCAYPDTFSPPATVLAPVMGTSPISLMAGAANALTMSMTSISSLDTGRIGYFTGWNVSSSIAVSDYGYAYTYAMLSGPPGASVDVDTGIMSFASPVAPGAYPAVIRVTNRENPSLVSVWRATLIVTMGVTSGRTGTQILHKDYAPDSGTWGNPTGPDWTAVFLAMRAAIWADQVANGDEKLRARILLRHGTQYNYTDNSWTNGIQYLTIRDDPAFLTGANPALCCNNNQTGVFDSFYQPMNHGSGSAIFQQGTGLKNKCAKIATANPGDTTVTLLNVGDASRLIPGRWHAVIGQQTQLGGYPPNCDWVDYVIVKSVLGSVVTLDRPLKYRYDQSWWEDPGFFGQPDQAFGPGYICPWDIGGSAGTVPSEPRMTYRSLWLNLTFIPNPGGQNTAFVVYHQGGIDHSFEGCNLLGHTATMGAHFYFKGCTIPNFSEPDKLSETIMFDGCTTANIGGATGFMYLLSRNSTHNLGIQISPRQLRMINGTVDASQGASAVYGVCVSFAFNGCLMYYDFEGATFKRTVVGPQWTWAGDSDPNNSNTTHCAFGQDGAWLGSILQIPITSAQFPYWLAHAYEGMLITTTNPSPKNLGDPQGIISNWGYVDHMTMTSDARSLLLDIVWMDGTRPTIGAVYGGGAVRRLKMATCIMDPTDPPGTVAGTTGGTKFYSPGFMAEDSGGLATPVDDSGFGGAVSNWTFPVGYPSLFHQHTPEPAGPLLLDNIPGATAAYSMRRLRRAYAGAALQLRRSSDNTTQDIGFMGDVMDLSQVTNFLGNNTGFVAKWYDQIGSADAVQATNANQPRLSVNAKGLTDTGFGNGKMTVFSPGTSGILLAGTLASSAPSSITLATVCGRTGNTSAYNIPFGLWASGADNKPGIFFDTHANGGLGLANLNNATLGPRTADDNLFHTVTGVSNGASSKVTVDLPNTLIGGTTTGTLAASPGATTTNIMSDNGALPLTGHVAESIYFNGVLSDPNIAALQADQYSYYVHIPLVADGTAGIAVAAYSTRRVSESHPYTSPCIRLQRSSDNAQTDIGFNPVDQKSFDHATYAAWAAGGGTITVVKWYDQVGSADLVPQDPTNPPTFVDAITPNGQPALFSNGAAGSGLIGTIPACQTPLTMGVVCNRTAATPMPIAVMWAFYGGSPDPDHKPGLTWYPSQTTPSPGPAGIATSELRRSTAGTLACDNNIFVSCVGRSAGGNSRINIDGSALGGSTGSSPGATSLQLFSENGTVDAGASSGPMTGYIAEALYWFGSIPDSDVQYVRKTHISGFGTIAPLLDTVTGAIAGYSLRRLRAGYTGPVVRIRRGSDNAVGDINFAAGGSDDLDVTTLKSFLAGSTGYVDTWYDQIGTANATAIGGLTANQAQIVISATTVPYPTGRPAVQATAVGQGYVATVPAAVSVLTLGIVANRTGNFTNINLPLSYDGNASAVGFQNTSNGGCIVGTANVGFSAAAAATDNAWHSILGIMNGASTRCVVDNGTPGTGNITGATGSTQLDLVGRSGFGFIGEIAEALVYPRALTSGEIAAIRFDHNRYYGTP